MRFARSLSIGLIAFAASSGIILAAGKPLHCPKVDVKGDKPFQTVTLPPSKPCKTGMHNGFPIPDPACTPGAINPKLTMAILKDPDFRTGCERDKATSADSKKLTYDWYGITKPADNREPNMICELDHLVSIELGGADTLDNIWPQCGPDTGNSETRYFKQKDLVENYLAAQIRAGKMKKGDAQKGIATDWTQYLDASTAYYKTRKKRNDGG